LLAGEYPGALDPAIARLKLTRFLNSGVDLFIDLTEESELAPYDTVLQEEAAALGKTVEHRRFPIRDQSIPSKAEMVALQAEIESALDTGRIVYVHCWGGIGRTGTVVGCYMVQHGSSAAQALTTIERLRRGVTDSWRSSPETDEQRAFVRAWENEKP
jgi:protein-tyrosine phosphatase